MMTNCMKEMVLLPVLCILWSCGCSSKQVNPLLGSWQSNEIETLKEIRTCGAYTENQCTVITSKIPFKDVLREIDEGTISSYYEGDNNTGSYKIISIDEPFVLIESYNPITDEVELLAVEVRKNRMWMPSTAVEFREVFIRIQ